ncbi:SDR family NAD(P)-dependent oxidoreductase [Oceaniglobus trochenteri]|uniref:SDR family NAD(P)-dependent oxidoreductase n=1 Tax=Oceaniglobus trochenteri TaxID=2763260 RepID=UPI001CFFE306|nr:SDR family oxidoreductase [Oceaniglobus trochenteri]
MTNTALITGASSGIGAAFARLHAEKGGDVVLSARSADALEKLAAELEAEHGIAAHVFPADLGQEGAAQQLYDRVKAAGLKVNILINNAGFGGQGKLTERAVAEDLAMIDLNIKALVVLTHAFGRDMAANGGGKILNVGSTAGFMPGPYQATYFATKAFVNSFSQAVDHELRDQGVTCTVLAPGYVETGFAKAANLEGTGLVKGGGATARSVAEHGYRAMQAGKLVSVNETLLGFVVNWLIPMAPRRMVLKMIEKMQKK